MHPNPIIAQDLHHLVSRLTPLWPRLSGKTLLVTGAQGFLLSYLADAVAALNRNLPGPAARLLLVDNLSTGQAGRLQHLAERDEIVFIQHDITQPLSLVEPLDYIIHGASIASPMIYRKYPLETIAANVDGTRHLLDLAKIKQAAGIVIVSSSEIYGDPEADAIPTPETYVGRVSCTGPRACYDESKRLAETLAMTYFRLHDTPVKLIRPFNVYGPGQRLDDQRVIPDMMKNALAGGPLVLFSDGRATRSFCYVEDAVDAILRVLVGDARGEAFNVGNDECEVSMAELAELVRNVAGISQPVAYQLSSDVNYVTDNPSRRCPDIRKLRAATGWQPQVGLRDGLTRLLASYRQVGEI